MRCTGTDEIATRDLTPYVLPARTLPPVLVPEEPAKPGAAPLTESRVAEVRIPPP